MTSTDKRRLPVRSDLAADFLRGKVDAPRYVTGKLTQLICASAPLRREGREDASLDTELLFGEKFAVYDVKDGWAWGQAALDDYVGYVPIEALGEDVVDTGHCISALRTLVFPKPDLKAPPLAYLSMNAKLTSLEEEGGYHRIQFGNKPGYVSAKHVSKKENVASDFVEVATQFLGAPYLWGGKQSLGLDCSGLVQTSLERAGIAAPRDANMQEAELGTSVAFEEDLRVLQRGDLVFWKGHVGIMMDSVNMIHANATAMAVSIDPVQDFAARIKEAEGSVTAVKRLL